MPFVKYCFLYVREKLVISKKLINFFFYLVLFYHLHYLIYKCKCILLVFIYSICIMYSFMLLYCIYLKNGIG